MSSAEQYKTNYSNIREEYDTIIKHTRQMIKTMTLQQQYQKAKVHILDALQNKAPRPIYMSHTLNTSYYVLQWVQSSTLWDWGLFLLSYFFIYLVILDGNQFALKVGLELVILLIFIFDLFIDLYSLSFDYFKKKNKYPKVMFYKLLLLILMVIDWIVFIALPAADSRPIRPFRILRAFIPVLFDPEMRKTIISLSSIYKDIIVYIVYYSIIIGGFALIGTKTLTFDPSYFQPQSIFRFDQYMANYSDLSMMIFQTYALATYDNYPDNQYLAWQNYEPNAIYFIVFIFLNMFLFVQIPATIFYNKFRENRSKYIIIDEIKQQHSLILAFVTLAQDQKNLTFDTLVKFLFFFYKNKVEYVQYITEICLKLDDNNNQTIQVNEFMELSKLLLYNSAMHPPSYQDLEPWLNFRRTVNEHLHIKALVKYWLFDTVMALLILWAAVNSIFCLFTSWGWANVLDSVFIWLFFFQILLRVIGVGPSKFLAERWNIVDSLMILISVVFFFIDTPHRAFNLIKMFRLFRLAGFIRILLLTETFKELDNSIVDNIKRVFTTFMEIMPIIVKFFNLFAFIFFIFGILCMEIFYWTQQRVTNDNYREFDQFSNFKTFVHSQYLMMQILTEGSWAVNAWSYVNREQQHYGLIIALFIFMHVIIVTVLVNLLKGIFWEVYFTVSVMLDQIDQQGRDQRREEEEISKTRNQINDINEIILNNEQFDPDTILKREIIEKKMDVEIIRRIKNYQFYEEKPVQSIRNQNRSKIVSKIMEDYNITPHELNMEKKKTSGGGRLPKRKKTVNLPLAPLENLEEAGIQQQEMEEFLNRLIINSKIKYSQIIAYPSIFVNFLNEKFKDPQEYLQGDKFDLNLNPLDNQQSMNFHMYTMNAIMGLESTTREAKTVVVNSLSRHKLINDQTSDQIIKSKHMLKNFHIDTEGAVRKMYLSQTNQFLVKKFEIQYFSDVYGNSFRQINKITLQPLLKFEASLTYTLWNLLRYEQVDSHDFFHMITHIEDQMSNELMKPGSLFKFVYKLDHESDIWFVVEQKTGQEMQVKFIKSGLWTQTNQQQENTTYYAKDVFNWDEPGGQNLPQQYMKLFFQSFQTLAFSLNNPKHFFESNPQFYIYDLYIHNFDVSRRFRKSSFGQLKICNIMVVVLCREDERIDVGLKNLDYRVSDIKSQPRGRKEEDFILDNDKQTYNKLKNMGAKDHQKIVESEGLPFAYILNLMKQLSDMLKLHSQRFVNQVQKALNDHYTHINSTERNSTDVISMPEVRVTLQEDQFL